MDLDLLRSAVDWRDGRLEIVDQTLLPGRLVVLRPTTVAEVGDGPRRLGVPGGGGRAAPAGGGRGAGNGGGGGVRGVPGPRRGRPAPPGPRGAGRRPGR